MSAMIKLDDIRIDGGTQARAELDDLAIADYAAIVREGADFPPVIVFFDGKNRWLADGFHRFHAYRQAGAVEISADVRDGSKRDAVLFSAGANKDHGLARTREDKRAAIGVLLGDAEWAQWSDSDIRKHCGVSLDLVRRCRDDLTSRSLSEKRPITPPPDIPETVREKAREIEESGGTARYFKSKHGTVSVMRVDNIGKNADDKKADKAARKAEQAEFDRQRDEARAALSGDVKDMQASKARGIEAREERAAAGLNPEQRIAELEEAVRVLEEENATLKAENAKFEGMRIQWEQGGFDKIVADKDETIRVMDTRIATESRDKVAWKRRADTWQARATEAGWSNDITIPLDEAAHG